MRVTTYIESFFFRNKYTHIREREMGSNTKTHHNKI